MIFWFIHQNFDIANTITHCKQFIFFLDNINIFYYNMKNYFYKVTEIRNVILVFYVLRTDLD